MLTLEQAFEVRAKRNELLKQTQRCTEADNWEELSTEQKDALKAYKQALRDVPQSQFPTVTSSSEIVWPEKPDFI